MKAKISGKTCKLFWLGSISYREAWQLQQELSLARRNVMGEDTLLLAEHLPVYTMGRSGSMANVKASKQTLKAKGVEVIEVDRGGDVTYHGPGQLVGYPILDLRGYKQDLHYYSAMLEEVIIRTLSCYGIKGFREAGLTGVWTPTGKVAAIGIGARGWVTMHGFSLNINPDMSYFKFINPCGITDRPVVSMKELGVEASLEDVASKLITAFAEVFNTQFLVPDTSLNRGHKPVWRDER